MRGIKHTERLTLKWGTLKGWKLESEASRAIIQKYLDLGASMGAMQQRDTPEQKQLICDLIDAVDGEIMNDWSGEIMSPGEAKEYVLSYGKAKATGAADEIERLRDAISEALEYLTSKANVTPFQRIENARVTLEEVECPTP